MNHGNNKVDADGTDALRKGQGAQFNTHNRFAMHQKSADPEYLDYLCAEGEAEPERTKVIEVFPKTIVNEVKSSDLPMSWSMNPYQGCEHGCSYCYARPTHEYWGYSAGVDFERVILVKKNAARLLADKFESRTWTPDTIMLSGNTDCYQPVERRLGITRQCLEVFLHYRNPVGIITKNALVQRDTDLLVQLSAHRLVEVVLSITTLDEALRQNMEPRTASICKRLETIRVLSEAGVPVSVMVAPIIPGLNSHEIYDVLQAAKEAGARSAGYTMVRLNGPIAPVFEDWIRKAYPDRADKVLNQVRGSHRGELGDYVPGRRMRGDGKMADQINQWFKVAHRKIFGSYVRSELNYKAFRRSAMGQLDMFSDADMNAAEPLS